MKKISNKTFKLLNTISNIIFFLSIVGLIFYSTMMADSIKWEMALPITLLVFSYLFLLKVPNFNNHS
ncbi:hypothetical protein [Aquibacillus rhizosphaerae]|uniref:Uncharacterized protein n=1 Tax=Aquibacillus rhizosphaerae TaxID=3051431 RepID=A0ABT7L9A9_9BACI|nr:hypothetical protein [Aquibacillus sp. LR5S19]MDL4842438.1 hypothetical protein [Aquibacillus sp. LR5S19]